jgi:NDP-sugar pyrophosphorylase family protein
VGSEMCIRDRVIIGEDCRIGPFCTILSGSSIGSRVTIEPYSMTGNSIIMNDVTIGSHSGIQDAVIGDGTVLKDHASVSLSQSFMEIEGSLMKVTFGAIIGDKVSAGPHTTFEGAIVGNNVSIRGGKRIVSAELAKDSLMVI